MVYPRVHRAPWSKSTGLTDEVRREPPWTMLFADDIVICEETSEEVERRLEFLSMLWKKEG